MDFHFTNMPKYYILKGENMKQNKLNIVRILKRFAVNRKHKDRLFQRVFADKKDLLDLYNAINGTNYADPDELEITTLEDVIYMSMKNDMSFIISSTLNLYEHQSTFNPNMPVRGLLYFARLYETYIKQHGLNIYGHKLIKLPRPQFIIFYNGRDEYPDEMVLKLSDAFVPMSSAREDAALECRATMLNINYGHNRTLLNTCRRLHDYSYFIAKVNEYADSGLTMEEAVDNAVDLCIKENILADILIKCRSEVSSMLLTEFDEKLYKKSVYKEGYEDGVSEGYERGVDEGHRRGVSEGYERGVDDGHRRGVSEGYGRGMDEGHKRGADEAREQDLMNSISMLRSIGISDDRIVSLIAKNYSIQKEEILNILKKDK